MYNVFGNEIYFNDSQDENILEKSIQLETFQFSNSFRFCNDLQLQNIYEKSVPFETFQVSNPFKVFKLFF